MATGANKRRQKRIKMVLPVRLWARDAANKPVQELAHTLDITQTGARLGAIRHELKKGDKLTLQYHQRKISFRIVWVTQLEGTKEYQIGIEAVGGNGETWGLELNDAAAEQVSQTDAVVTQS